jgi:hypothetical protein
VGISLKTERISDKEIDLVNNGSKKMYVVMLAIYANSQAPINRIWVTEVCARITKPFNDFESCPANNRYFFADRFLARIN